MSYQEILQQPVRQAIVRSILSRENASRVTEIVEDTKLYRSKVNYHLGILVSGGVLMRDYGVSDSLFRERDVYYISYQDESLQNVLRVFFPDLMREN